MWPCGLALGLLTTAVLLALAGFGVHPSSATDPHSSFRCPPPVTSAWGNTPALEHERSATWANADGEVNVHCTKPARRRLVLAIGAIGISVFLAVSNDRRPATRL